MRENNGVSKRYCRRCLLQEMEEEQYFADMRVYIENLDKDIKVTEAVYQERLAQCKKCDSLISGMCRICGCFVEMRAVMKKNACPGIPKRWQSETE